MKPEFNEGEYKYKKGDDNMDSKTTHQNDILVKRTQKRGLLLLGFILLFIWFGIRLVVTESPEEWREADITVADVQHISFKPNRWQITDTEGNTYVTDKSNIADQILSQSTYHMVWSPDATCNIRAVTQGDSVIVDYAHSVSVFCERNIWDWLFACLGLAGSLTTVVCMIVDIRKETVIRYGT